MALPVNDETLDPGRTARYIGLGCGKSHRDQERHADGYRTEQHNLDQFGDGDRIRRQNGNATGTCSGRSPPLKPGAEKSRIVRGPNDIRGITTLGTRTWSNGSGVSRMDPCNTTSR